MTESSFGDDVEGPDAIIWELDPATSRFTYVSAGAEAILGYPVGAWLEEPGFWERLLHPQDRARAVQSCRAAVLSRRDHWLEYRAIAADGRVVWLRDHVSVAVDEGGAVTRLRGIMIDMTGELEPGERTDPGDRRTAERMRAVAAAATSILDARTIGQLATVLRTASSDIFSTDAALLALYREAADTLEVVAERNGAAAVAGRTLAVAGSPLEPVVREGRSLVGADVSDPIASRVAPAGMKEPHPAMWLAVRKGTRTLGVLTILGYAPHRFDRADIAAAEALAGLAAAALVQIESLSESRAAEAALRNSERFLKLLQQVTAAANESATFEEAASRCMAALCRHTGWPTAHLVLRTPDGELASTGLWERNDPNGPRDMMALAARIRYEYGMGLVGRVAEAGQPVWIEDVTRDAGYLRSDFGSEVRGAFAFPVMVGAGVAAILEFFSRDPVAPDDALLDAAGQIGIHLGRVLERERAQEQIRFQARVLDAVGQAVVASDISHRIVYWNRAAESLYGWTREEALGRIDSEVVAARADTVQTAEIVTRLAAGESWAGEFTVRRKDGTQLPVHITGSAIYDASGTPAGYLGIATDLSRSKELEAQLRQAQKLEAVGQLAGGVAHDFNNLLTNIKGTVHLLLEDLGPDNALRADIEEIRRSADRAASLTSQLLAFSRRQVLQPRVFVLNDELVRMRPALDHLAGEKVRLELDLDAELGRVRLDAQQFGHVLTQLVANARDAMNGEGRIVVRTCNIQLTHEDVRRYPHEVRPGGYVMIDVQDSGPTIESDEVERIFDPFFTPRRRGRPPGLGLSTVYGIVKQSGGYVWVESAPGVTRFRIVFPRVTDAVDRPVSTVALPSGRSPETLLLVEDEDTVRRLARRILTRQGYNVLEAANGVEAIGICENHDGPIDLVVTDVVMPEMGGGELAERLRELRPQTPVLMVSGYAEDAVLRHGIAEARSWFLEKPFTPDQLLRKVREVLEAEHGSGEGKAPRAD